MADTPNSIMTNAPAENRKQEPGAQRSARSTLVLLVRHGQTPTTGSVLPGRAAGLDLAPEGLAQARLVAERIRELGEVKAVYASPLERTMQTAAPIAKALKVKVRPDDGLIECDFGRWTGRKLAQLRKREEWVRVQRHPSGFRFPDGESFAEMQARALDAVSVIAKRHRGQKVVAVSHADVIKAVVAAAAGTPLDLFQRFVVSPCSLSAVLYSPGGPTLLSVNNTGDDLKALKLS